MGRQRRFILRSAAFLGFDSVGRLVLNFAATAILGVLLGPEIFGLAAMTFALIAIPSTTLNWAFEEALVQRRKLERAHIATALTVTLVAAGAVALIMWSLSPLIGRWTGHEEIAGPLMVVAGFLLLSSPSGVLKGLARRWRKFGVLAGASSAGSLAGAAGAVALALAGAGVWSLIAQKLILDVTILAILLFRCRVRLGFGFSTLHLRQMMNFAAVSTGDVLVEKLFWAGMKILINAHFGLAAVGWFNMAQRTVDPIRSSIEAIQHKIAFSYFVTKQSSARTMGDKVSGLIPDGAYLVMPIFAGLCAVMPVLLPLILGEAWRPAVITSQYFAATAAFTVPLGFSYAALGAFGRPEFAFYSNTLCCVIIVAVFLGLAALGFGSIAIGLSYLIGELAGGIYIVLRLQTVLQVTASVLFMRTLMMAIPSLIMAVCVAAFGDLVSVHTKIGGAGLLVLQVIVGCLVYGVISVVFLRQRQERILSFVRQT